MRGEVAMRVVITEKDFGQNYAAAIARMAEKGYELVWNPLATLGTDETLGVIRGFDAVIAGGERYDQQLLEQVKGRLKIIARLGSGYDNVDLNAAAQFGIAVTNSPGRNARAVAEHALALMLCVTRGLCLYDRQVRQGIWSPLISSEFYGKTVGIVGFGAVGRWLARLLGSFSCRILAYDKAFDQDVADPLGVEYADLDTIAALADVISLHIPYNTETEGSFGINFFRKMKRSAILINTARGKIVKEDELVQALREGMIAGAGVDVYPSAPIDSAHALCSLNNVVLSPHASSLTDEAITEIMECCVSNVLDLFDGRTPKNLLNYPNNWVGHTSHQDILR